MNLSLHKPVTTAALEAFRADVRAALEAGTTEFAVDIDDVGVLDSLVISTLIAVLRDARERGAAVSLRAGRKNILETLRITALDQVFAVHAPTALPVVPPVVRRPVAAGKRGRLVAAFAAGMFGLGAMLGSRASAALEPSAHDMVRNVVAQNDQVESYQAQVSIDLHLRSFPYVSQHLDGTTYFKRPDNFEVVFAKVPSYAKGFEKIYSDIDDPTSWERRFDIAFAGERNVEGHRDVVVRLVQKVRGMIDHEDVAIDPETWRIDAMEWHYYNGGLISMSQEFTSAGRYKVLAKQHATIHIPFVRAAADATYSDYRTNVAIDDSVFTRGNR